MENEIYLGAVNSNQEQGIQEQVQAKAVASFASGEVAYLLNAADGNAGTWGQGESMPVFAGENISESFHQTGERATGSKLNFQAHHKIQTKYQVPISLDFGCLNCRLPKIRKRS